ncbi:hypothetical protein TKK_0011181 [Trichogramma kaykai]
MTQVAKKRGRDLEEDGTEFTPLSKRINNIHINNMQGMQQQNASFNMQWNNPNLSPNHSQGSSSSDCYSPSHSSNSMEYSPDLNAQQNPQYYESNKMLFNLHMERLQRRVDTY